MLLSNSIEELVLMIQAEGRSPRTVRDYRQKAGVLLAFLGDVSVEGISLSDLRRYAAHLRSRSVRYEDHPLRHKTNGGLSEASIASYLRVVKRLFSFLVEEGILSESPARRLPIPRSRRREPKAYLAEDLPLLLAATADCPRDRALLLFLIDTGCRVGGLCGLHWRDVDLEQGTAIVLEKGNQQRMVFFGEMTRDALEDWLQEQRGSSEEPVFSSLLTGGPLSSIGVHQALRRLGERAGARGPVNPHAFRHGFAREYLLSGGDLGSLADILGHRDVRTTWESYAIFRQNELAEKHRRHSPAGRLNGFRGDS